MSKKELLLSMIETYFLEKRPLRSSLLKDRIATMLNMEIDISCGIEESTQRLQQENEITKSLLNELKFMEKRVRKLEDLLGRIKYEAHMDSDQESNLSLKVIQELTVDIPTVKPERNSGI